VRLGDVCAIQSGGTPSRRNAEYWKNGTIPWVKIGDFNGDYIFTTEECITEIALNNSSAKIFPVGTILYTIFATLGEVAILTIPSTTNQAIAGITILNTRVDSQFLVVYLKSIKKKILEAGRGVAQNNINLSILKGLSIPLPPLEAQQKIADVLVRASTLIEKRKTQIEKLDLLVKSQFIEMFGDPVPNPKGWEVENLGILGDFKNGINFRSSDAGYQVACLGVGDFKSLYTIDDVELISKVSLTEKLSADYYLQDGDIVFVRSNGNKELVGRSVAVYPKGVSVTFSGFCIRFRKTSADVDITYLNHLLHSSPARARLLRDGRGANIQNLNQQMLSAQEIMLPPLIRQNAFVDFVHQVDKSKFEMQQSLVKLEQSYQSLMQKCFRGDIF